MVYHTIHCTKNEPQKSLNTRQCLWVEVPYCRGKNRRKIHLSKGPRTLCITRDIRISSTSRFLSFNLCISLISQILLKWLYYYQQILQRQTFCDLTIDRTESLWKEHHVQSLLGRPYLSYGQNTIDDTSDKTYTHRLALASCNFQNCPPSIHTNPSLARTAPTTRCA